MFSQQGKINIKVQADPSMEPTNKEGEMKVALVVYERVPLSMYLVLFTSILPFCIIIYTNRIFSFQLQKLS